MDFEVVRSLESANVSVNGLGLLDTNICIFMKFDWTLSVLGKRTEKKRMQARPIQH